MTVPRTRAARRAAATALASAALGIAALGVTAPSASAVTPAGYDICDTIWTDWVYDSAADQAADWAYCRDAGHIPWDAPVGSPTWMDDHSA
jgi:hypothetical protein